jgi:hypothetical protein
MKLLIDLFSTDYGLMSIAVVILLYGDIFHSLFPVAYA